MSDNSNDQQIIRQVNHYFSDRCYPRDKFMQKHASEGEDNFIPLSVLATFNKLKDLGADEAKLKEVLAAATPEDNFQLKEDGSAIRRNPDKEIASQKDLDLRTIYAKGFDVATISVDTVQEFFDKQGYPPEHVQVRRNMKTKELKPSAFVQFASVETAKKVADEKLVVNDTQLEIYMKEDYFAMKNAQKKAYRQEKQEKHKEDKARMEKEAVEALMDKDCVVKFSGAAADTSRENLKDVFEEYGEIAWVDFSRGETEGFIRFKTTGSASKAVAGITEKGTEVNGAKLTLSALEGEEETEYWIKLDKTRQAAKQQRGGRGRGRGRGGKRRGGGRGGNRSTKRHKD